MDIKYMQCGHEVRCWKFEVGVEIEPDQIALIVNQMKSSWLVKNVKAHQSRGRTSFEIGARGRKWSYRILMKNFAVLIAGVIGIDRFNIVTFEYANNSEKRVTMFKDFFGNYTEAKDSDLQAVAA